MQLNVPRLAALASALLLVTTPGIAFAYIGPGLGLGAISSALGILGAVVLALISILWYPAKRLVRRLRGSTAGGKNGAGSA